MNRSDQKSSSDHVRAEERLIVDATEEVAGALAERGWTRARLAAALGVRPSEITQRLRGQRNLTLRSVAAMLDALDFDVEITRVSRRQPAPSSVRSCGSSGP
jgi:transcriptional regulator with XRE-family HTH domain